MLVRRLGIYEPFLRLPNVLELVIDRNYRGVGKRMWPPPTEGIGAVGKFLELQSFYGAAKQIAPGMGFCGEKIMWLG